MSLTMRLRLGCFPALGFGLRAAVAKTNCVYTQSVPPTLSPSLAFTAGRCHFYFLFFTTITQKFHYFPFHFHQLSRLPYFFFLSLSGICRGFQLLWQITERRCVYYPRWWSESSTYCDCVVNRRKWMFKSFANENTAVYKMPWLRGGSS